MGCSSDAFTVIQATVSAWREEWESASGDGARWLFLSDAPETYTGDDDPAVLYRCAVTIPASGSFDLRAFIWHVNGNISARNLRLVLQLATVSGGGSGSFTNHKRITSSSGIQATGLCVAIAQLARTLDAASPASGTLVVNTPFPITLDTLDEDEFYGAVHEMTITGPVGAVVYIWTVMTSSADNGTLGSTVVDPGDHLRGRWQYSDLVVSSEEVILHDDLEWRALLISCWEPNCSPVGIDDDPYRCQTADSHCKSPGNKGMYGVNGTYIVRALAPVTYYVSAYLRARNTGGSSYRIGAAYDQDNSLYKRVPELKYSRGDGICLLTNRQINGYAEIEFEIASGGSATLPCELLVGFSKTYPVPDPGS